MKFKRNVVRVGDYLQQSGNQVEKEGTEGLDISGISSGFKPLDELTGGWHGSDLIWYTIFFTSRGTCLSHSCLKELCNGI